MSRPVVMALGAAALVVVVLTIAWVIVAPDSEPAAPTPAETENRRQKAHDFLGGDPDRDVRGGQEMKPRW
ncbi:entry exclusion protein TrbK (plasmid) [Aminobacter sp. NyZ550]|uniref:entry exclusion protein TrbK n=1 Tax=unclassified Aminobacter TaxID=2644704 RepID=UPI0021D5942B|nr:entry exclusion protein TrbK [Aminobacter sp. NyZ550]WAX98713.1 entry exclusion protein TrbK [Aminobacter sp. NyZ550]